MTATKQKRKLSPALTAGIGGAVVLVIALAGWMLLISPQRSSAAAIATQVADVQAQIVQARVAAKAAENTEPVRTADLFRLTKAMPSNPDIAGVLLELSKTAAEAGIVFEQITPSGAVAVGSFRALPIEVVFTGDFYTLSDFLYRLRNLVSVQDGRLHATGMLFSVDKITFSEAETKFPHIKALLSVSALLYGTAGEPAPGAAATPTDSTNTDTAQNDTGTAPATTEPPPLPDSGTAAGAP